jgi:PII-like signaling protein
MWVDEFGKRGRSYTKLEGITVNMPTLIKTIDERSELEPILPQIKWMVGDNGILAIEEEVLAL